MYNNKLLVGERGKNKLFVYNQQGSRLFTITTDLFTPLMDALWAPYVGYIVYTTIDIIVVKSSIFISGKAIHIESTKMQHPLRFSVSNDDIIYVAVAKEPNFSVYQSSDYGITWSLLFKSSSWKFLHAIEVTTVRDKMFWTYAQNYRGAKEWRMRVRRAKSIHSSGDATD